MLKSITQEQEPPRFRRIHLARAMRVEWLGQTAASMFWIASVLTYGISSAGDWLQMGAASAWLIANLSSLVNSQDD